MSICRNRYTLISGGLWHSAETFGFLASPSARSYNRCISDFANASSKFLASLGTSDMPRTLTHRRKSRSFATVRYHVDVFPEDLEEAAEMLAGKVI